jgi:arylsulfatase A-like enzyme
MIQSMDDAIGTLLDTLDRLKIADNTIIIFTSDNGGNMYNEVDGTTPTSNRPLRGGKATMFEGGTARALRHRLAGNLTRPERQRCAGAERGLLSHAARGCWKLSLG